MTTNPTHPSHQAAAPHPGAPAQAPPEDEWPEPGTNPDGTPFKLPTGKDYVAGQPIDEAELAKTTADEKARRAAGHPEKQK